MGHLLSLVRQNAFVGRDAEEAAFRSALHSDDLSTVLYLHGAGGTGKTTLLRRFATAARQAGRYTILFDHHDPETVMDELREACRTGASGGGPAVVLIDDFDGWGPHEPWLREHWLPRLPLGTVVVVAGRNRPVLEWTVDPGWLAIVRVHELRDLADEEAGELLDLWAVPPRIRDAVLQMAGGNPLAMRLAIDALTHDGTGTDAARLSVAHAVLEHVVGPLPSPSHRQALELSAAAGTTTETTLDPAAGDAAELFAWLRSQPFVDPQSHGVMLRRYVSAAVTTDLRWRNPGALAGAGPGATALPPGTTTLSRAEFDRAVRDALRTWRRPDLLAANPLVTTRLVTDSDVPDPVAALRSVLETTLEALGEDSREGKAHRALRTTYLKGAPTQEAAAERLGLPFSTYRRHLTRGLSVLTSLLWHRETGQPTG